MFSSSSLRSVREIGDAAGSRRWNHRSTVDRSHQSIVASTARQTEIRRCSVRNVVGLSRAIRKRAPGRVADRENRPGSSRGSGKTGSRGIRERRNRFHDTSYCEPLPVAAGPCTPLSGLIRASDIPLRDKRRKEGSVGLVPDTRLKYFDSPSADDDSCRNDSVVPSLLPRDVPREEGGSPG